VLGWGGGQKGIRGKNLVKRNIDFRSLAVLLLQCYQCCQHKAFSILPAVLSFAVEYVEEWEGFLSKERGNQNNVN